MRLDIAKTILAVGGFIAGGIFIKRTVDVYQKVDKSKPKKEIVTEVAKEAIKPAALILGSAVLLATTERKLYSENSSYKEAYGISNEILDHYDTNGEEVFGHKKWKSFIDEMSADYIYSDHVNGHSPTLTGFGNYLCYDTVRKEYFRSNIEQVRRTERRIFSELASGRKKFMSVNDFYRPNKLATHSNGNLVGWSNPEEVVFNHSMHMAGNEPCLIISYKPQPKYL